MTVRLAVRLLGAVAAAVDGVDCRIKSVRQQSILGVLASEAGQVVPVDRIVDAVWAESPPPSVTNALQVHLWALRKALGRAAAAIETRAPGYLLDTRGSEVAVSVDAVEFEKLARTKLTSGEGPDWDSIAALWTGAPFAGMPDAEYARFFAERLNELHRGVVEAQCDQRLAMGLHDELVPDMEAYVEAEPYRERRWRQWVLALYRCGRQAEALATFQRARARLIEDLGIEPGPALAALEHAVLAQDPALEVAAVSFAGSPLPRPTTPTIGRGTELERIAALIAPGGRSRIVTLTGPGGVGKTRLAQELGRRLAGEFDERVAFCDLSDITDADLVVPALARSVGVPPEGDPIEAIIEATVSTTLIVVDNAERVTAAAAHLGRLAQRSQCRFLVTSRVPLHLSGEQVVAVGPLDVGFGAQLFQQRVEAVAPGVVVDDATARKVAAAIDGLPLAIELAAALSRMMSPDEILGELSASATGLDALTGGPNDAPARHRSLTATLAWSVGLLSAPARSLLVCLGSFATSFSLGDVVWLAPDDTHGDERRVRELAAELVDSSLVIHHGSSLAMLPTVRAYVRSLARSAEREMLADRHAMWVRHIVDDIARSLDVSTDEESAMAEFTERLPDLRAAHRHLRSCGRLDDAVELLLGTRSCWVQQGAFAEVVRLLEEVDHEDGIDGVAMSPLTRAKALAMRGVLAKVTTHSDTAIRLLERAAEELRQMAPASTDLVNSLCHLAADRAERNDHAAAAVLASEAVTVAEASGSRGNISMAWDLNGYVARLAGDWDRSILAAQHAVDMWRQHPALQLPYALSGLAEAFADAGRSEEAVAIARQAIEQATLFSAAPTMLAEVTRRSSRALATADPAIAAQGLAAAAASYAAVGMQDSLAEAVFALAGLVAGADPVVATQLMGASIGPAYLDNDERVGIEGRAIGVIGQAAFNAEQLRGKLLDPDAIARLAAHAAQCLQPGGQLVSKPIPGDGANLEDVGTVRDKTVQHAQW